MTANLSLETVRKQIADDIRAGINDACVALYDDGFRNHLGASEVGNPCARRLWYGFRWVAQEEHGDIDNKGRKFRLFNRGHATEPRLIQWLEHNGFKVWSKDEQGNQYRITGDSGHYGGSGDGILEAPEKYQLPGYGLLECKTSGTGKKFSDLATMGVRFAKPVHWAQMCQYGYKMGLQWGLYFCINKNDDDIHVEICQLDWSLGADLVRKGDSIALSDVPPPRLCANTAYIEAKICSFVGNCFHQKPALKSCRSCTNVRPQTGGTWLCTLNNATIPADFVPKGCDAWKSVT